MGAGDDGFWVFGYGSLMWRPGFDFAERRPADLVGWRRAFCLTSIRYRGTPEAPGLVLGLDRDDGAECRGVAYRVEAAVAGPVRAYLRERELVTYAYRETTAPARFVDGGGAETLVYVVDRSHAQYAGDLDVARKAALIAERAGPAGSNIDYFRSTLAHLRDLGVEDPELEAIDRLIGAG